MEWALLATFVAYFIFVVLVGFAFYRRETKMEEYFLADRQLNPYVVALSAQATDMSGWLLMGLPGAILVAGVGEIWIGIGLAIGTYFAWRFIAKRLRIFSEKSDNSITISEFFSNRLKEDKGYIRILCGVIMLVFFTVYVASAFVAGGKILNGIFTEMDYIPLMLIGAAIIVIYTFLGGFKAVCWTDFFQGLIMLVAVIVVPLAITGELGGIDATWEAIKQIPLFDSGFSLDLIGCGAIAIISGLAWGIGYMGMPHILVRYMSISNPNEIKVSRRVAIVWVVIALAAACIMGLIGRVWVMSNGMYTEPGFSSEMIFIYAIDSLWAVAIPALAGILFAALMAAVMSTADSQLLVSASSVTNDIVRFLKKGEISEGKLIWISRGIVIAVAIIAAIIATDRNSSIMTLVSFAWAGFGAAFGPIVILCLFWKKITAKGALAGIFTGFASVFLWNTFLGSGIIGGKSFLIDTPVTGLYELAPAFVLALIVAVVVSLLTYKPDNGEIDAIFDEVNAKCKDGESIFTLRKAGLYGIVAAAIFFVATHLAESDATGWSIATGTLSELGVYGGVPSALGFIALFVGGLFLTQYGWGMMKNAKNCNNKTAGALMLGAALCLMVVGFIDMNNVVHTPFLILGMILGYLSIILSMYDDFKSKHMVFVGLVFIVLLVAVMQIVAGAAIMTTPVVIVFAFMGCALIGSLKNAIYS